MTQQQNEAMIPSEYPHINFEDVMFRMQYNEKVMETKASEQYRRPVPGEGITFAEESWADFQAIQQGKIINLHTYRARAKGQRKAVFVVFHGLNSHIGRAALLANTLAERGIETVGFDFRGFGKSEGIRGWCESFEQHIKDASEFVKIVEENYPNERIFIGGQSWGGQTAYKIALENPDRFAGTVLFAPAIKDNKNYARFGKRIARILAQTHGMANKNPSVPEGYPKDEFMYLGRVIPGTVRTLLNASDELESTFSQFKAPFVVMTAGIDKLVDPLLGFDLMKQSPAKDKSHIFYENCWHNMWAEEEIHDIIEQTSRWILHRSSR